MKSQPPDLHDLIAQAPVEQARTVAGALSIYVRVHEWMEDPAKRERLVATGFVPGCYRPDITAQEIRALAGPVDEVVDRMMRGQEFDA
jgi:hypothetical protein